MPRRGPPRACLEVVDGSELEPNVEVVAREFVRPHEIAEGLCHLAQIVVCEAALLDRAGIGRVELEDAPILEDRLRILLARGELIATLQVASFLSFRRPGAPDDEDTSPTRRSAVHPPVVGARGCIVSTYLTDVGCRRNSFLITHPC